MINGASGIDNFLRANGCPDVERNFEKAPVSRNKATGMLTAEEAQLRAFIAGLKAPQQVRTETRPAKVEQTRKPRGRSTRKKG